MAHSQAIQAMKTLQTAIVLSWIVFRYFPVPMIAMAVLPDGILR